MRFTQLKRNVTGPKADWICKQLAMLGIAFQNNQGPLIGRIILVESTKINDAIDRVLKFEAGRLHVAPDSGVDPVITIEDLPDDHELFTSNEDIETIGADVVVVESTPTTTSSIDDLFADLNDDPFAGLETITDSAPTESIVPDPPPPAIIAAELATPAPVVTESALLDTPAEPIVPEPVADVDSSFDFASEGPVSSEESSEPKSDPELDWQRADKVLPTQELKLDKVDNPITFYGVDSSNLKGFGRNINQAKPEMCTAYIMFGKGDVINIYRYGLVSLNRFNQLLSEAVRKEEGLPEASVGSLFHVLIKEPADKGEILCQRLKDGEWIPILPKSQRVKEAKKNAK